MEWVSAVVVAAYLAIIVLAMFARDCYDNLRQLYKRREITTVTPWGSSGGLSWQGQTQTGKKQPGGGSHELGSHELARIDGLSPFSRLH